MAVERSFGIPVLHKIYKGNSNDAKTFNFVLSELIFKLKKCCRENSKIVLVLDKGNRSYSDR
jgi:transposase